MTIIMANQKLFFLFLLILLHFPYFLQSKTSNNHLCYAPIQNIVCGQVIEGDLEGGRYIVDLGISSGMFVMEYTTYEIPDGIEIYQDGNLLVNFGCVNTGGSKNNEIWHGEEIKFRGNSSQIEIVIYGNCSGLPKGNGTGWKFEVKCPQSLYADKP
jgi:hypothetical protein